MELLQLGARTVALGLLWQPRESTRKRLKVEARELAEALAQSNDAREFSHVALRPKHQEYGLAERFERHVPREGDPPDEGRLPRNVLALAGVLADQKEGRWAGSYALAQARTWVVCVIGGQVLADGDVVLDEAEAASRLLTAWRDSYPGLEIEEYHSAQEAREVLTQAVAKARAPLLVPLAGTGLALRPRSLLAAAAALILVGVLPSGSFTDRAGEQGRAPPVMASAAPRVLPPVPSAPSHTAIAPTALGAACVASYLRAPITVAGWWMLEWRCEVSGTLAITWRRATDGSFLQVPPGAQLTAEDPNLAHEQRVLYLPPPHALTLTDRAQASAALYEVARLFGLQLTVTWPIAAALPAGVQVPGQSATPPAFHEGEFTLATAPGAGAPVPTLFEALGRVPGLALRSVTWREQGHAWSTEGVMYAPPPSVKL